MPARKSMVKPGMRNPLSENKRKYRFLISFFTYSAGILLFILLAVYFFAPSIIENSLLPYLSRKSGLRIDCKMQKFTTVNTVITDLDLEAGTPGTKFVTVGNISLDYKILKLLKERRIDKISVTGFDIHLSYCDGKFSFLNYAPPAMKNSFSGKDKKTGIPFAAGTCEIRNSNIVIYWNGNKYVLPFEVSLKELDSGKYYLTGKIKPFMQEINFYGEISESMRGSFLCFYGDKIKLSNFSDLTGQIPGLAASGEISLNGKIDLEAKDAELSILSRNIDLKLGKFRIQSPFKHKPELGITRFDILAGKDECSVSFSKMVLAEPFPMAFSSEGVKMAIGKDSGNYSISGLFETTIDNEGIANLSRKALFINNAVRLRTDFSATFDKGKNWKMSMKPKLAGEKVCFNIHGDVPRSLVADKVIASVRGEGSGKNGVVNFAFKTAAELSGGTADATIPSAEIFGSMEMRDGAPKLKAFAKLANSSIGFKQLKIRNLSLLLPFEWPVADGPGKTIIGKRHDLGMISAENISFGDFNLGSFSSDVYQDGIGYISTGIYTSPFEDVKMEFCGNIVSDAEGPRGRIDISLMEKEKSKCIRTDRVSSKLPLVLMNGNFEFNAHAEYRDKKVNGSVDIEAREGSANFPAKKLEINGINFKLAISDLLGFRSPAGQKLSFSTMKMGKLLVSEGKIEFQVDSPKKYYVDKGEFSYCDGHVYTHSLRIAPGERLDFIFYCDRMKLASIINQFSEGKASGEGTVNGRIPVSVSKENGIKFRDGFLYSTPGLGGKISIRGKDFLPEGTPVDDPHFLQIAIASEALKDFDYKWVRISINSEEKDLFFKMQMDGRPAGLLPFGFTENNGFFKDDKGPGADFKEIEFEFNFIFPFERILDMAF